MKYVHKNHKHYYYINRGVYNYSVRQYSDRMNPGSILTMDSDQFQTFIERLKKGGWYEQSTSR